MSFFLNSPFFLIGLSFIIVPIILHVFPRLKPEILRFSNIKIFKETSDIFRRNLFFRNLLRLLLRILFIVFLTLAFAHPLINKTKVNTISFDNPIISFKTVPSSLITDFKSSIRLYFSRHHNPFDLEVKEGSKIISRHHVPKDYRTVDIEVKFEKSGTHRLDIYINRENKIAYLSLNVKDYYNILLVSSKKNTLLERFFSSFGDSLLVFRNIYSGNLSNKDLKGADIVIFPYSDDIDQKIYDIMQEYLNNGGNLWLFPSSEMNCDFVNKILHSYSEEFHGFSALDYGEKNIIKSEFIRLYNRSFHATSFKVPIRTYNLYKAKKKDPDTSDIMLFGKEPLAVLKRFGKGRTVTFLSSADKNNPLFVNATKMPIFMTFLIETTMYRENLNYINIINKSTNNKNNKSYSTGYDMFIYLIIISIILLIFEFLFFLRFKKI